MTKLLAPLCLFTAACSTPHAVDCLETEECASVLYSVADAPDDSVIDVYTDDAGHVELVVDGPLHCEPIVELDFEGIGGGAIPLGLATMEVAYDCQSITEMQVTTLNVDLATAVPNGLRVDRMMVHLPDGSLYEFDTLLPNPEPDLY